MGEKKLSEYFRNIAIADAPFRWMDCTFCGEAFEAAEGMSSDKAADLAEEDGWKVVSSEAFGLTGPACAQCVKDMDEYDQYDGP